VLYAAVSIYWGLGGTRLLSTVAASLTDGPVGAGFIVAAWIGAILKLIAAVLPLVALRQTRPAARKRMVWVLAWVASVTLILYGLVLTVAGLLIQAGVVRPSAPDGRALAWHAYVWDPWFLIWGLLIAAALWRSTSEVRRS
jgi:uncharacterized membrane protein